MSDNQSDSRSSATWRNTRYGLAAFFLLSLVAAWLALRLVLFFSFRPDVPVSGKDVLGTFLNGLHRAFFVALLFTLPLLFWFLILPNRWFGKLWHRLLLGGAFFLFWLVQIFLLVTEYYFFEEFRSRFNSVAVDYLLYPQEVLINIWVSHPVAAVLFGCALLSSAWLVIAFRLFRGAWTQPMRFRRRLGYFVGVLVLCAALTPTIGLKGVHASTERTLNEIADNGAVEAELEKDAIALCQIADDLYMHRRYRIDGEPSGAKPASQ